MRPLDCIFLLNLPFWNKISSHFLKQGFSVGRRSNANTAICSKMDYFLFQKSWLKRKVRPQKAVKNILVALYGLQAVQKHLGGPLWWPICFIQPIKHCGCQLLLLICFCVAWGRLFLSSMFNFMPISWKSTILRNFWCTVATSYRCWYKFLWPKLHIFIFNVYFHAYFLKNFDFEDFFKWNIQYIFGSITLNYTEDDFAW